MHIVLMKKENSGKMLNGFANDNTFCGYSVLIITVRQVIP